MKLAQLLEMTMKNLTISFKNGNVDLVYGRNRISIFTVSQNDEDEYVFSATKYWDSPTYTVKAKDAKSAYRKIRENMRKKIYGAFGGASKEAERVLKKLEQPKNKG